MHQETDLTNQFLLAMPQLQGSWFERTVVLICQHDEHGAMGITLSKNSDINLGDIYEQLEIEHRVDESESVIIGGPVKQEHGFVLHLERGSWQSTVQLTENLYMSTSKDILKAIAEGTGPRQYRVALGYAGWDKDQLEQELTENSWLTLNTDSAVQEQLLFDIKYDQVYSQALAQLGVDESFLSSEAGHA